MKKNKKNFDKKSENKVEKTNSSEIVVEGTVIEAFPNAMFDIQLDNGSIVKCTICGKIRKNNIRILLGDRVQIGLGIYDLSRGRILYRLNDNNKG